MTCFKSAFKWAATILPVCVGVIASTATFTASAAASDELREQRALASQAVTRKQTHEAAATLGDVGATSIAARLELGEKAYRQGQSWAVSVVPAQPVLARKAPVAREPGVAGEGAAIVYRFKVEAVQAGGVAEVSVRCDGCEGVSKITIDSKRRVLATRLEPAMHVGLDLFPLSVPAIPDPGAAVRASGDELRFEGEDAFARKLEVVWIKGDPWPLSMRGAAGTANLLRGEVNP